MRMMWTCGLVLGANLALAGTLRETPDLLAKGKSAFSKNCALCHAEDGNSANSPTGKAMNARNLISDPFKSGDSVEKIFETITKGLPGTAMAPFAHIPEEDRWGISYLIKSWRKAGGAKGK